MVGNTKQDLIKSENEETLVVVRHLMSGR